MKHKIHRERENIHLIRVVERHIGAKTFIFWYSGDQVFTGRACHMHALKHARSIASTHSPKKG